MKVARVLIEVVENGLTVTAYYLPSGGSRLTVAEPWKTLIAYNAADAAGLAETLLIEVPE